MEQIATLFIVLVLALFLAIRVFRATSLPPDRNRNTARRLRDGSASREEHEAEIIERLKRIRARQHRDAVASAVEEDPQRAAKVLRRMMEEE